MCLEVAFSETFSIEFEHPLSDHQEPLPKNSPQFKVVEEAAKVLANRIIKKEYSKEFFLKVLFFVVVASSDRTVELAAISRENANFRRLHGSSIKI